MLLASPGDADQLHDHHGRAGGPAARSGGAPGEARAGGGKDQAGAAGGCVSGAKGRLGHLGKRMVAVQCLQGDDVPKAEVIELEEGHAKLVLQAGREMADTQSC